MFKFLGILLAIYTIYAATHGEVYAKRGMRGAMVSREDTPVYFWSVIVTYGVLSLALLTVF